MCIIAVKPADKVISEDVLRECFLRNPDGAGISYVDNGKIKIEKGIRTADKLIEIVTPLMDRELVIHCRVASRGMVVNDDNCHPFYIAARVNEETKEPSFEYAVSHNGTLEWGHTHDKSDTNCFTEQFLTPMFESHPFILTWEWGRIAMERTISFGTKLSGRLNKMVIMTLDRRDPAKPQSFTYILNDFEGNWQDGIWFSNHSWDKRTRPAPQKDWRDWRTEGFLAQYQKGSIKTTSGNTIEARMDKIAADIFRWYSQPDSNGWFWSYLWDAWINMKTGVITRSLHGRQQPPYMCRANYNPVELAGRQTLTKGEVDHLILGIMEKLENGEGPPATKMAENVLPLEPKGPLDHLDPSDKSLICKKAYDVILWSGEKKGTVKGMSALDKVTELRQWVKSLYDSEPEAFEIDGLTNEELDLWIVHQIKNGELTLPKVEALYKKREATLNHNVMG